MTASPVTALPGRRHVVIVYTRPLLEHAVESAERIIAAGGRLTFVGPEPLPDVSDAVTMVTVRHFRYLLGPSRVGGLAAALLRRGVGATVLWWLCVRSTPQAMVQLRSAHVVAAADQGAVFTVWQTARKNPFAMAVNGIAPTLQAVGVEG